MSEFMIAGLLAPMSASLGRSEPTTALMVTAFAAAVVLSAPATSALTVLLRPKATLVGAMVTFVAAHLVTALVPVFWVMLVLRLVAGVACATFLSVGTVTGVRMVTPAMAPRAISIMVGGLTVSNVVGLPVAAWVGTALGWRAAFWLVAVLAAAACAVLVWTRIDPAPSTATGLRQQLVAEVRVLVRPTMLITFAIVIMFQAGMFATFTFLQPLTTIVGGVSPSATGGLLAVFGLGTLIGVALGGAVAHRGLLRNVTLSLVATSLTLILLMVLIRQPVLVIGAVVFGFGVSAFSISAALNGRVFALAGDAPTLASGMNISMLNLGNAIGPAVAGMVISANQSDYLLAPASSLGFITMALVGVAAIILTDRRHRTTADQDSLRQHS
ncbi:MAG: MFS transporter [Propionibacteriales bacterium]|nr:MFS transporter [Propionibacteriales bacterium]